MDELLSMLNFMGMKEPEDLFSDVPGSVRKRSIGIGSGLDEHQVVERALELGRKNSIGMLNFLGNGIYDRIIPEAVNYILSKPEFLDSYTPYQPEISQGMLQSLFEYQSLISDLMAMDVTNASMYDGYSALGEAARMAYRINGKKKILIPDSTYDSKLSVLKNYVWGLNMEIIRYKIGNDGMIDLDDLSSKIDDETSAVVVENPNGYGILDKNVFAVKDIKKDAALIAYVDPISLGAVKPPGEYGADIAVAEGQQLGIPMNFGGPLLGIMSFKMDHIRRSPGRIIGESVDSNGRRAYVMTLQTREQHIRRAKATSNICSNQALLTLAASAYLSIMGSSGLKKVALLTIKHSRMLKEKLSAAGIKPYFDTESFSDVMFRLNREVMEGLASRGILGGLKLTSLIKDTSLRDATFFTVTEKNDAEKIEKLAKALEVI